MDERLDRVLSRRDGIYWFLDLPAGSYTLTAMAPHFNTKSEKNIDVVCDKEGNPKVAVADFQLSG
jgi:hypothetical protein